MEVELLTGKEVANMLRISPSSVTSLRNSGALPFVRIGRRVLFTREAVLKFIADMQVTFGE